MDACMYQNVNCSSHSNARRCLVGKPYITDRTSLGGIAGLQISSMLLMKGGPSPTEVCPGPSVYIWQHFKRFKKPHIMWFSVYSAQPWMLYCSSPSSMQRTIRDGTTVLLLGDAR